MDGRVVDGRRLDVGTSGMLYIDNLVMYDRQAQSLWPQLTGLASVGALTGTQLEAIPIGPVACAQFRDAHPDARVLTPDTGHDRDYGSNPYVGYDKPDGGLLAPYPTGPTTASAGYRTAMHSLRPPSWSTAPSQKAMTRDAAGH